MLPFVDTHCHLDFDVFAGKETEFLDVYRHAGVTRVVIPATKAAAWPRLQQLGQDFGPISYAIGSHPWFLHTANCYEPLEKWLNQADPHCIALGETGLDRLCDVAFDIQVAAFRQHLECAQNFFMPLIIHSVKAHGDVLSLLHDYRLPARGVIHGFHGSFEQALAFWKLGFLIGVGHTVVLQRSQKTLDAIRRLPAQALLLETDAPSKTMQTPQETVRGFQTIFAGLCALRREKPEVLTEILNQNAKQLFAM